MKKLLSAVAVAVGFAVVLQGSWAHATIWKADTRNVWPGWEQKPGILNTVDVHGVPQLGDAQAVAVWIYPDTRELARVAVQYASTHTALKPGDLFLAIEHSPLPGAAWDYVVRTPYYPQWESPPNDWWEKADIESPAANGYANWDIWSFASGLQVGPKDAAGDDNEDKYQLSQDTTPRDGREVWSKYGSIRRNHPWAVDGTYLSQNGTDTLNDATFSGWQYSGMPGYTQWDFAKGTGLTVGEDESVIVGFTVNCTNDVLYEIIPPGELNNIPEPGTLAIWGLLGLLSASACWWQGRRRKAHGWSDENRQAILEIIDRGRRC